MVTLAVSRGNRGDYQRLQRFHHLQRPPATYAAIFRATASLPGPREELAAVLVVSNPVLRCREREAVFGLDPAHPGTHALWVNRHLLTISRVIVHPRFRGLGLAVALVRAAILACPTPVLEARARIGHALPLFEHAGMTRAPTAADRPAYYWIQINQPSL
jgi:GNAT superfamily N-acetyltransferase